MSISHNNQVEPVWLSTVGFAHGDGVVFLDPIDQPTAVQDFLLGADQMVISHLVAPKFRKSRKSLASWVQFNQVGSDGRLLLDEHGKGNFSDASVMTLEKFYEHNPQFTDLTADDLRRLGGFDV